MTEEQLDRIANALVAKLFPDRRVAATVRARGESVILDRIAVGSGVMLSMVTTGEQTRFNLRWSGKRISIDYKGGHKPTCRGQDADFVELQLLGAF